MLTQSEVYLKIFGSWILIWIQNRVVNVNIWIPIMNRDLNEGSFWKIIPVGWLATGGVVGGRRGASRSHPPSGKSSSEVSSGFSSAYGPSWCGGAGRPRRCVESVQAQEGAQKPPIGDAALADSGGVAPTTAKQVTGSSFWSFFFQELQKFWMPYAGPQSRSYPSWHARGSIQHYRKAEERPWWPWQPRGKGWHGISFGFLCSGMAVTVHRTGDAATGHSFHPCHPFAYLQFIKNVYVFFDLQINFTRFIPPVCIYAITEDDNYMQAGSLNLFIDYFEPIYSRMKVIVPTTGEVQLPCLFVKINLT